MISHTAEPQIDVVPVGRKSTEGWLAAGGFVGALLAPSCCIVPLTLVTLGLGGSWVSQLTALEPYRPVFLVATLALLGAAFWHVYFRSPQTCEPGGFCALPTTSWLTKAVLWSATVLASLTTSVDYWAPLFY